MPGHGIHTSPRPRGVKAALAGQSAMWKTFCSQQTEAPVRASGGHWLLPLSEIDSVAAVVKIRVAETAMYDGVSSAD